ncbi:MAG: DUF86 domain-containing protein [Planctomycetota bacterium]
MKDDKLYLIHIRECIERVEQYAAGGKDEFLEDTMVQDAVLRNLQTLSESSQRLSSELKQAHPGTNWRGIAAFRNVLVHGYLGVNIMRVWEIIEDSLPGLKQSVEAMLDQFGE